MLEMHDRISFGSGVVKDILVLGVAPQYRQVRNLIIIAGRFFDEKDDASHAQVAVVTEAFARQKFGTTAAVNRTFEIKGIPFTVIGTFKEAVDTFGETEVADQTILIPYSVARYFTGTDDIKMSFLFHPRHRRCGTGHQTDPECDPVPPPAHLGLYDTDADRIGPYGCVDRQMP